MKRDDVLSCPICGRGAIQRFRPFCSARCADIDLGRWLTDSYAIPVEDDEPDEQGGEPALPGHGSRS